jgi:dienelactone hydrolase
MQYFWLPPPQPIYFPAIIATFLTALPRFLYHTFMKNIVTITLAFALSLTASAAAFAGEVVTYSDDGVTLEGYWVSAKCSSEEPAPVVLIIHQWMGLGDYEKGRAEQIAENCYNAFAIDMYGKGIRLTNRDDARKQSSIYKDSPGMARKRIQAALDFARAQEDIDADKVATMGYCFGGTMALELARSGADINGVVSFHGGLATKAPATEPGVIQAAVQVHHGAADPYVPPEQVQAFISEMRTAKADWHLTQYADAVHAFTEKHAGEDPSTGAAYNQKADERSWESTLVFLKEIF